MKFDIIAGAANNQMATPDDEDRVAQKHILYVPDYAINAGGVIAVAYEYFSSTGNNPFTTPLTREAMMNHVGQIGRTIEQIFVLAETQKNHNRTGSRQPGPLNLQPAGENIR